MWPRRFCEYHSCFARLPLGRARRGTRSVRKCSVKWGDANRRYGVPAMMKRLSEPALALGLAVALALSAVTPSVGQTTRRHAPAAQEQGLSPAAPDETFGQRAPQAPS